MFRRHRIALLASVSLSVVVACGGDGGTQDEAASGDKPTEPTGTLRIAAAQDPESLDFQANTTGNIAFRTVGVAEGLYAMDADRQPQLMLAENAEAEEDGARWTFTLREDVQFHNGEPLTAEDVVASFERWINVEATAASWFADLTSMEALDDQTVQLEFSRPMGVLPTYLASTYAGIIPAESAEAAGTGVLEAEDLIGTGPYMLDQWETGVSLTLKAFPEYSPVDSESSGYAGRKEALIDTLEFVPLLDEGARLAGLQTEEFGYAEALSNDQYEAIEQDPNLVPVPRPIGAVIAAANSNSEITGDPAFRRAVLRGMDMEEIGLALGPEELWNLSPTIPMSGGRLESEAGTDDWNAADVDGAIEMLAETDYDGSPITLISTTTAANSSMAIVMQQQLENMGIEVNLEQMEVAAMQERRAQAEGWDFTIGQLGSREDITQISNVHCGNTSGGYCSDELNALMAEFQQAIDPEEQFAIHEQMQELYYRDLPYIKGPENLYLNVATSSLQDFDPDPLQVPRFWGAWLDESEM